MHVELFHTGKNLLLQFLLTIIPRERQGTTPPFKVVHLPPGKESRTSDKLAHLLLRIAELEQHVSPNALLADNGKWQIHPMECHPVDFLFPALPVPESHRIGERAVIEVVAQTEIRLMTLFLADSRQYGRQLRLHLVPRKMDTSIILEIPVDT